jgi:hypothetical protein
MRKKEILDSRGEEVIYSNLVLITNMKITFTSGIVSYTTVMMFLSFRPMFFF